MGRPESTRALQRGVRCAACGMDQWKGRTDRSSFRCWPCLRKWKHRYREKDPAVSLWRGAKKRAREKGFAFTITPDDVRAVWPEDGRCPVFGTRLVQGRGKSGPASATLDRLNSKKGYEKGNIAVISHAANTAKGGLSVREFTRLVSWMKEKGLD